MTKTKPYSFVWKYYEKSFENDKKYGICIFCKKRFSADTRVFREHLSGSGCKCCPDDVRRLLKKYQRKRRIQKTKNEKLTLNIYICDCKFRTTSLKMWTEHKIDCKFKLEWKTWHSCDLCPFKTKYRVSLFRHKKMRHPTNNSVEKSKPHTLSCSYCNYKACKSVLEEHIISKHVNVKPQKGFQFQLKYNSEDAKFYKRIFGNLHKCKKCPYFTKSLFFLKNHLRIHEESRVRFNCGNSIEVYFCGECHFTTNLITSFDQHIKISHHKVQVKKLDVKKYKCGKCSFQSFSSLTLLKHQESCPMEKSSEINIKFFDCIHCSYKTVHEDKFRLHMNAKHTAPEEVQWFRCDQCEYKNKDKGNLTSHIHRVHMKRLTCQDCSYKTSYPARLKRHINLKHKSGKEAQWFTCSICEFKTRVQSSLRQHVYTHVKKDRFQCKHCEYKTVKKSELNIHVINKHTADKDMKWFKCDECEYKGKHNRALKLHKLARHTPDECINWVYCAHCEYRSKDKVCLKRHLKSKHRRI